jgi:hypothetical protein
MLTRIMLMFLVSICAATAKPAENAAGEAAEQQAVDLAGFGSRTCSDWLSSPDRKLEGAVWIYGFWSGLNYVAVASEQKQARASSDEIVTAVEKVCRREPSRVLASAAWAAYIAHNTAQP